MLVNDIQYKVGVYIRLSKEDEDRTRENESESVSNQRKLIIDYLHNNGFYVTKEYVDDGFTGTSFDRPAFNNLIKDIENKEINMVITKDLSRLGRDYIKSGYYIEEYFPKNKIRYISILDGIDTFIDTTSNDIAPFKALFNDMTSKDTSKKIRSILKNKKEQGKFLGSSAPFGYKKDNNDKHKLVIDNFAASIVKRIFELTVKGYSPSEITVLFNKENVITPIMYKGKNITKRMVNPKVWTISSIYNILRNREYTGCLVQNVFTNLSYKNKLRIKRNNSEWIIVEDTHEAIIDKNTFEYVSKNKNKNNKLLKERDKLLLEGLIYCSECGCILGASYNKNRDYYTLMCNRYKRNHRLKLCTPHYINYNKLEELILKSINKYLTNNIDIDNLTKVLKALDLKENDTTTQSKLDIQNKVLKSKSKLETLYEDRFNEVISVNTYKLLSLKIEEEINSLNVQLENINTKTTNIINYDLIIKDLFSPNKISRDLIFSIIDRIEVTQDKTVNISYKFNSVI